MKNSVINIILAGIGGQGVLKASDILCEAVFQTGIDVKKSEIHGMSQRGGSVTSDIRFGEQVLSPMIPIGSADFLVVLSEDQVDNNRYLLSESGTLLTPDDIDESQLSNKKSLNVALLGALSAKLDIPEEAWKNAIIKNLPENIHEVNFEAFEYGRKLMSK